MRARNGDFSIQRHDVHVRSMDSQMGISWCVIHNLPCVRLWLNEALPRGGRDKKKHKLLHAYSLLKSPANFAFSLQIPVIFASGKPPNAKVNAQVEDEFNAR